MLFTPEFVNNELKVIVLVSNHGLSTPEAIRLSISYNRARIAFGFQHMPKDQWNVRIIYDVRGQGVPADHLREVTNALSDLATVEYMR